MILILLIGYKVFGNEKIAILLNRFDFIQYILWTWIFSLYIFNILDNKNKFKLLSYVTGIINSILIIFVFILPVYLYRSNNLMYAHGPCVNYIYIICTIYSIFIILNMVINCKRIISKRFIPIFILGILIILTLILNKYKPELLIIPAIISYVDLIIFFTIENPDLKSLKEYKRNKELAINNIEEKSNILFKITQDVKEPIKKINNISNQILNYDDIHDAHIYAHKIYSISAQLSYTINGVLNISDLDLKKVKIMETPYSPYNLFSQIILKTKKKFDKNIVSFKYDVSPFIPKELYGDYVRLKQIIFSIINNSFRNTHNGYVDFDITSIVKNDMCRLVITISDTSNGMLLEEINDILSNDNYKIDEELNKIDEMNVDIRTIKKIIDIMGGKFYITSNEDFGCNYVVIVDQKIKEIKNEEVYNFTTKLIGSLSNKTKVLIIDDDFEELYLYKKQLEKNNLTVLATMYGDDINELLKNNPDVEAIFIDDEMKPKNAVEVIKNINTKKIKTIIMLNSEKETIRKHYLEDYLFKDFLLKRDYKTEIKRIVDKYL